MRSARGELLRFGIVGGAATAAHATTGLLLVRGGLLPPLSANLVAFLVAVCVSYTLNRNWTFGSGRPHREGMPRFLAVSLLGLVLNQSIVALTMQLLRWSYAEALAVVLVVVPALSFLLMRAWVFRRSVPPGLARGSYLRPTKAALSASQPS